MNPQKNNRHRLTRHGQVLSALALFFFSVCLAGAEAGVDPAAIKAVTAAEAAQRVEQFVIGQQIEELLDDAKVGRVRQAFPREQRLGDRDVHCVCLRCTGENGGNRWRILNIATSPRIKGESEPIAF